MHSRQLCCALSALMALIGNGSRTAAQEQPHNAADSAALARSSYVAARNALRDGKSNDALMQLTRAVNWWPSQPAYSVAAALVGAQSGDTALVLTSVKQLVRMQAGIELLGDGTVQQLGKTNARVGAALAELRAATSAVAKSGVAFILHDSTFYPEGIDADRKSGTLYVTSIRHGVVVERNSAGIERIIRPRSSSPLGAIMAVATDLAGTSLWITAAAIPQAVGYTDADSTRASLLHIRRSDGEVIGQWTFAAGMVHAPGSIALAPNGDVYVSDSRAPHLYRLRAGADSLDRITSPLFRSLQGVAPSPDGRSVYIADYSHGLLRLDVSALTVERVSHGDGVTTVGLDGINLYEQSIVAVQNGFAPARIVRFQLDRSGRAIVRSEIIDRNSAIADEPVNGVIVGNAFLYIGNSQWEKYDEKGARVGGTRLNPPMILRVPLTGVTPPQLDH